MKWFRFYWLLLAFVSVARADRVDDYVRAQMQQRHLPAVSVAIVRDGKVDKARGYGVADLEHNVRATERTVYRLASVSKQFTATAIMLLVQDGKLGLDDPIAKYLDGAPEAWSGVAVRDLLNHTAGVRTWDRVTDFTFRQNYTLAEFVQFFARFPLDFAPRERWSYSNTGYALLGGIIEKVSGNSYADFLAERIFKPSGMTATSASPPDELVTNRAEGYLWADGRHRKAEPHRPAPTAPSGGVLSNVVDLAKWDLALHDMKFLPPAVLDQRWTPARLNNGGVTDYGFGWRVDDARGHRLLSHSGSTPGFSTFFARYVEDRITVIILTNLNNGGAPAMARTIAGLVDPALAPPDLMKPQPDHDPGMRDRLIDALNDLAAGKQDSPRLTRGLGGTLNPRGDAALATRLNAMKTLTFIARDDFPKPITVRGEPAVRVVHYKLATEKETWFYSFHLTADGKVADLASYAG